MNASSTLIPPGRLGALLTSRRCELDLDLVELAQRSNGRFTPSLLSDIERGRTPVDDMTARVITELYELDKGPVIPERSRLVVDLEGQQIAIGGDALDFSTRDVDVVLERYLSLLYILRSLEPGTQLTLREPDLKVLSETLLHEIDAVERRLGELMLSGKVDQRTRSLLRKFILPSAGLLVAATAVGSLVIVSGGADAHTLATPSAGGGAQTEQIAETDFEVTATVTSTAWADTQRAPATRDAGDLADNDGGGIVHRQAAERVQVTIHSSDLQGAAVSELGIEAEAAESPQPVLIDSSELSADSSELSADSSELSADSSELSADSSELSAQEQLDLLGQQAQDLITYDWESVLPGWTVLYEGDSPGYKGLTHWPSKTITIYIDDGAGPGDVADVLAHELGHALDVTYMDNDTRTQWLEARGMPMVWWAGNGLNDFSVGAGDFAEAVAALWVDSPSDSTYGEFTDAQLQLVADLLPDA